jgi:hypothetical protein
VSNQDLARVRVGQVSDLLLRSRFRAGYHINSVNKVINSSASTAALILRGKETRKDLTKECCILIQGLLNEWTRDSEGPECEPVSLHRASQLVGTHLRMANAFTSGQRRGSETRF